MNPFQPNPKSHSHGWSTTGLGAMVACEQAPAPRAPPRRGAVVRGPAMVLSAAACVLVLVGAVALAMQQQGRIEVSSPPARPKEGGRAARRRVGAPPACTHRYAGLYADSAVL